MPAAPEPRLAKSHAANVVLVILTLFPGLINTSAVLPVAALGLATITLQRRDPHGADEPVDRLALAVAAAGSGFVYFGAAALVGHDWSYPPASIPVAPPLVPVRKLFTSLALVGTLASVLGSVTFGALTQCFVLTLLRVPDLAPLLAPDRQKFDAGKPALDTPALA